jgi:hypothetical protein
MLYGVIFELHIYDADITSCVAQALILENA